MVSSFQSTVLWIACGGMFVGVLAIGGLARRAEPGERHHFAISAFVCFVAFGVYYAMANGYGAVHLHGREEFFARYIDWSMTTPLLIGGLVLIGLPPATELAGERRRDHNALIGFGIFADFLMILTGLCAGLTTDNPVKYGFYAISCLAFAFVLWVIWGPVRAQANAAGPDTAALYGRLVATLTLLWFVYPVVWILGTEGVSLFGSTVEIVIIAAVDLSAKVLYGLMTCTGVLARARTQGGARRAPRTAADAAMAA